MKPADLLGTALVVLFTGTGCAAEVSGNAPGASNGDPGGAGAFSGYGGSTGPGSGGTPSGSGGASGGLGASGSSGASGAAGATGASGAGSGGSGAQPNTAPGFINLAPPMGQPLTPEGATVLNPPAPTGWNWYPIDGAVCRDGSPNGILRSFHQLRQALDLPRGRRSLHERGVLQLQSAEREHGALG